MSEGFDAPDLSATESPVAAQAADLAAHPAATAVLDPPALGGEQPAAPIQPDPALPPPPPPVSQEVERARQQYQRQAQEAAVAAQQQAALNAQLQDQLFRTQLQLLPPEQREQAVQQRQFQLQQEALRQAALVQQQQLTQFEPVFKEMTVRDLVQQYAHAGVRREYLEQFGTPDAMEAFCKVWAENYRAQRAAQTSAAARVTTQGTGGSTGPRNWRSMSMSELASEAFR